MTIDQIIAIVGHTATWLTLVIVFFTLKEMSSQRRHSYKPVLIPLKTKIYGYWQKLGQYALPKIWSSTKLPDDATKSGHIDASYLNIVNLGVGAASDIRLNWHVDLATPLHEIKNYCYKHSIPIVAELNDGDMLSVKIKDSYRTITNLKNDLERTQDYILPASVSPDGWHVRLPFAVKEITSLMLFLFAGAPENKELPDIFFGSPDVEMELFYMDLGGDSYSKRFTGKLNICHMSISKSKEPNNLDGQEAFLGYWEFREK